VLASLRMIDILGRLKYIRNLPFVLLTVTPHLFTCFRSSDTALVLL
jgi:hypothetical protein